MVLQDGSGNEFVWVSVNNAIYKAGSATIPTNTSNGNTYYKPMAIAQSGSASNYESIVYSYSGVKSYRNTSYVGIGKAYYKEPDLLTGNNSDGYTWNVSQPIGTNYDASTKYYLDILGFSDVREYGNYINKEYRNMVNSTNNFGGFYIGRYETSANEVNVDSGNGNTTTKLQVQSKAGKMPISNLKWYELYLNQDSNRNSNNTYYETSSVTSNMIWGSQYDAMLNWALQGNEAEMVYKRTGNHSGSPAKTGAYGVDVMNNIFDLSANLLEWTQEAYSTYIRVYRGGNFYATSAYVVGSRNGDVSAGASYGYGSRLTLYLRSSEP